MNQAQIDERNEYLKSVKARMPRSNLPLDLLKAFIVGGLFCVLGQGLSDLGKTFLGLTGDNAAAFTSIAMLSARR